MMVAVFSAASLCDRFKASAASRRSGLARKAE